MKKLLVLITFALMMPTAGALAHGDHEAGIVVEKVWARKTSRTVSAAVYLSLTNDTHDVVTLVGAGTAIANTTMIHQSYEEDGIMKMDHVISLPVTPGETLEFSPGGYHIMLMGLARPLEQGDVFPLTLSFENRDPVEVIVEVTGMMGPQQAGHH
jgi:copper(I)-binding protein